MSKTSIVLKKILNEIGKNQLLGLKSLVVFDLDSTLFDVSPRIEKILHDFACESKFKKLFPDATNRLLHVRAQKNDWGIRSALERHGFINEPQDFYMSIRDYWLDRFFSNDYLEFDVPYKGAVEFTHQLKKLNTSIKYLTGRDFHRMGDGTFQVLKKWNFPLTENGNNLILKPHKDILDTHFKKDWFSEVQEKNFDHIWFFENEPLNIEEIEKHHPKVQIVFFNSTHSGKAKTPTHLPQIEDYDIGVD